MRILLIFSTILALLGCPLRCAVGQVWEISSIFKQTTGGFRASGCACCARHSQPMACDNSSSDPSGGDSESAPLYPTPNDCDCLCLCKGAIVEKQLDLPAQNQFDEFLSSLVVDEPMAALQLLVDASYRGHGLKPSDPCSGRLLRLTVQSLLI